MALSVYNNNGNMEKIYLEYQKKFKPVKASTGTIEFLISYSSALYTVKHKDMKFNILLN